MSCWMFDVLKWPTLHLTVHQTGQKNHHFLSSRLKSIHRVRFYYFYPIQNLWTISAFDRNLIIACYAALSWTIRLHVENDGIVDRCINIFEWQKKACEICDTLVISVSTYGAWAKTIWLNLFRSFEESREKQKKQIWKKRITTRFHHIWGNRWVEWNGIYTESWRKGQWREEEEESRYHLRGTLNESLGKLSMVARLAFPVSIQPAIA